MIAVSLGLTISLLGSPTHTEESRVIDNTPSVPSICQITPNSKIEYSKVVQVLAPRGEPESAVFDQNYDDALSGFFSEKKPEDRKLFFTAWFLEGILFTGHQDDPLVRGNWSSYRMYGTPSEYGTDDRFSYFVKVGESVYPLEISEIPDLCKYGAEEISWHRNVSSPVLLKFSDEARAALKRSQQSDKVAIFYRRKDGNRIYETSTPIGQGTISAWKQLEIASPESTLERAKENPMEAKVRRYREGWKLYGADTQGWLDRVNNSKDKYDGFYSARPNVNCHTHPSLRAPVAYVVTKPYTLLPWYAGRINPKNPGDFWLAVSPGINQICWMHRSAVGGGD
ncbi:hypothetical protein [Leptolyngbya sp. GGD]|uniref:hypothetical protein n=1 Tax=Leptolyngbya sp. GGD TaxID=2997907 RepID=UPI00227B7523|nr:hypothetical protein [Leptolyngbya sp. GGD]MCY6493153.1 hypothetical protein [Leptolyngbya sp. GGD]